LEGRNPKICTQKVKIYRKVTAVIKGLDNNCQVHGHRSCFCSNLDQARNAGGHESRFTVADPSAVKRLAEQQENGK
jgi:hypothetical protein